MKKLLKWALGLVLLTLLISLVHTFYLMFSTPETPQQSPFNPSTTITNTGAHPL